MNTIERWIRTKLAAAVAAGIGEWGDASVTTLGRPIYRVTNGGVSLVLYDKGFSYMSDAPFMLECRYDEVTALKLPSLIQLMQLRGDLDKMVTLELTRQSDPDAHSIELPLRIFSQVASVLNRIVNELAPREKSDAPGE